MLLDESSTSLVRVAASSNGNVTKAQARVEEANFPDCMSVLPSPAREGNVYEPGRHGAAAFTHTRIGVNAKQLAQTLQVVSDLAADDTHNTVVMTVPVDPHRPIRLDARCTGRRAAAAIMPVHADFQAYDECSELARPKPDSSPATSCLPAPTQTQIPVSPPVPRPKRSSSPTPPPHATVRRRKQITSQSSQP
jgi:hypothetical protein